MILFYHLRDPTDELEPSVCGTKGTFLVIQLKAYALMIPHPLSTDLGERMVGDPSYLPLENLPEGHHWAGPADLKDLVAAMLSFDPILRPDAGTVLHKMEALCSKQGLFLCKSSNTYVCLEHVTLD